MKVVIYYDFIDELYRDGRDSFFFTMKNYPYELDLKMNDVTMPLKDIIELNKDSAREQAAFLYMSQYGDFLSGKHKNN